MICKVEPRRRYAQHLSGLIHSPYLFMWRAASCIHSEPSRTAHPSTTTPPPLPPSIFTNASQVLGTAGLTLISLKYLFHPSSEQIEQKHRRLFEASANALETSPRQKPSARICSLGL